MERPDLVERNHFRESPDGSTVFFPWRLTGRGYILADEKAKRSASRIVRTLYVSMFAAAGLAYTIVTNRVPIREVDFADFLRMLVLGLLFMLVPLGFYVLWLVRAIYDLPPSDFHLSREELRIQALANAPRTEMRKGVVASAVMAAVCLGVGWIDPDHRWLGAVGVVVFGGLGLLFAKTLRASREIVGDEKPRHP